MLKRLILKRLIFYFPLLLFLFSFLVQFVHITSQEVSLDEPFSIYHAQFDFFTIISQLKNYNNPPLFELMLHVWIKFFGISNFSVRFFPMLFACLSPLALFYLGKRFFSLSSGIFASLLLSCSSLLIFYAHDCRVYSLFLLLTILSMYLFLSLLSSPAKKTSIIVFIVVSTLLIYAHYFGFFVLSIQGVHVLCFCKSKLFNFIKYYTAIFLLYTPQLVVLLTRFRDSIDHGTWLSPPNGIDSLYNMLWSFSNYPFVTVLCLVLFFAALIVLVKNRATQFYNKNTTLVLLWFLIPFFGMFFLSYKVPMYISRYLIFIIPAYYLLLPITIDYIFKNKMARISISLCLIFLFGFTTNLSPTKKRNIQEAISFIEAVKDSRTLVIIYPRDYITNFAYNYKQKFFSAVKDKKEYFDMDSLLKIDNVYCLNAADELTGMRLNHYKKVIFFKTGDAYDVISDDWLKLFSSYQQAYSKKINDNANISLFRLK